MVREKPDHHADAGGDITASNKADDGAHASASLHSGTIPSIAYRPESLGSRGGHPVIGSHWPKNQAPTGPGERWRSAGSRIFRPAHDFALPSGLTRDLDVGDPGAGPGREWYCEGPHGAQRRRGAALGDLDLVGAVASISAASV